jgi:hypothetical protein
MTPELHRRFKELDRSDDWEHPKGFDYFRALGEVVHHQPYIGTRLQAPLWLDHEVQDASYFCELSLFERNGVVVLPGSRSENDGEHTICPVSIRFSAFDRMFTVLTGAQSDKYADRLVAVVEYLSKNQFLYVTRDELSAGYDGREKQGTENWTWFTRFFDYL